MNGLGRIKSGVGKAESGDEMIHGNKSPF